MDKQEIIDRLFDIADACAEGSATLNEAITLHEIVRAIVEQETTR